MKTTVLLFYSNAFKQPDVFLHWESLQSHKGGHAFPCLYNMTRCGVLFVLLMSVIRKHQVHHL